MYNANINPYTGDMYHENPLILVATNFLINKAPLAIPYLIIALDLATGWLLYKMAQRFIREMVSFSKKTCHPLCLVNSSLTLTKSLQPLKVVGHELTAEQILKRKLVRHYIIYLTPIFLHFFHSVSFH